MPIRRTICVWMVLLTLAISIHLPQARAADDNARQNPAVLLLYDSMAMGGAKEGNVQALERVLAAFGVQVTSMSFDRYEAGTLGKFRSVIALRNAEDLPTLPEAYTKDLASYEGAYLHIGSHIPDKLRQELNLEETTGGQDTIDLSIGQLAQSSVTVSGVSYISRFTGTAYGSLFSEITKTRTPYGVLNGRYGYIPYLAKGDLSAIAAAYVLKDWLGTDAPARYYVVFKDIYPFSDLDMLSELADRLYEAGIPFIASVQPVLSNIDYPAMQRYLEVLKHVQSRNGTIVVNAPVVASTISQDITVLKTQMSAFLNALAAYGVAPLGIGTEMYWTYDRHYADNGLGFFDSGIIFPDQKVMYRAQTDTSKAFASSVYTMSADEVRRYVAAGTVADPLPMNTAFTYSFPENRTGLEDLLNRLLSEWTAFSDYKNEAHSVRTEAYEIASRSGHLQINGNTVMLSHVVQDVSSEHTYVEEGKKSLTTLFSVQNNIFIGLILSTLLIFAAFLIIGYRLYKRKYTNSGRSL